MTLKLGAHCLLFVAAPRCAAQNLVPNHSFEERDSCLEVNTAYTVETGPLGWFSAGGTGDYFLSCIPYGGFNGVPLSSWAFQYPQDGECYLGVITYIQSTGIREYFMIQLAQPLVPGQMYYASFYASPTWGGPQPQMYLASSHIGMLFTTQPRHWSNADPWPTGGNFAHVYHPWLITDTVGWTLVSGSFVADSAYQYLMIGNHFDNAMTDTLHFADFPWDPRAHTLIDNVCVTADSKGCPLALGVEEPGMDAVVLFPNPASTEIALSGVPLGSRIRIHDALGRLVLNEVDVGGNWRKNVLPWARGTYVLRLERQGRLRSFKFVLIE
ncbi:MAG: T9SS type A sorting domain-containing protein [Flavobacteriales bacterium]|nr:T9SS type A sorting domain-containing protein [Flavobacteriales bacterium]